MDEIILSFDSQNYSLNEGNIINGFLNIIDNLIEKIINILKNIRNKIKEYFENNKKKKLDDLYSRIDISKIDSDFSYIIPNKDSIKVYLDAVYVESYERLIINSLNLANKGKTKELYIDLFGKYPCDTYSDNNNFIYGIINYLERIFGSNCRDREDLNNRLKKCLYDKNKIKYVKADVLKSEFKNINDISKTSIGKDLEYISEVKDFTLNYFNQITNKNMIKIKKLKKEIEKNANNYDDEIKLALTRLLQHYTNLIKGSDIYAALEVMNKMENDVLNKIKSWV